VIVVDTSVWVDYLRYGRASVVPPLQALLDLDQVALVAPVRIELLSGAGRRDLVRLKRVLSALPLWLPTDSTWATIENWVGRAAARGQRFGVGDLLVAGIAAEHGAAVWSLDGDFARLKRLGLVALHAP
jgi:predicted nucleic acid-binding protein